MKIDKNIPIPARGLINSKYPLDEMEVGDSFCLNDMSKDYAYKEYAKMNHYMRGHYKPYKLSIRKIRSRTFRIWKLDKLIN